MKAEELMIGDLISFDENVARIVALRSKEFAHFECDGEWTICLEQGGGYWINSVSDSDFAPIHLTDDIIKANGFVEGVLPYILCNSELQISLTNNDGFYAISIYAEHHEVCDLMVRYVHELQNVLRVCGLSDIADNWKVENLNKTKMKTIEEQAILIAEST